MAAATSTCYYCGDKSYTDVSLDCGVSFTYVPDLTRVQYTFAQAQGATTVDPITCAEVEVCPGTKTRTGTLTGNRCFRYDIEDCLTSPNGIIVLRTYIPNCDGIVDGSTYHEVTARRGCDAGIDFNKRGLNPQEYSFPLQITGYAKPVILCSDKPTNLILQTLQRPLTEDFGITEADFDRLTLAT